MASKNRWTKEEDEHLRRQVLLYQESKGPDDSIPWRLVAHVLPGRSNKDCRKRWYKIDQRWSRGPWQSDEKTRLKNAVVQFGTAWVSVSEVVRTRNPDQCAKHWQNAMDPNLTRGKWNEAEDANLLEAVSIHGHKWSKIRHDFPGRSQLELSNRLVSLVSRRHAIVNAGFSGLVECHQTRYDIASNGMVLTLDTTGSTNCPSPITRETGGEIILEQETSHHLTQKSATNLPVDSRQDNYFYPMPMLTVPGGYNSPVDLGWLDCLSGNLHAEGRSNNVGKQKTQKAVPFTGRSMESMEKGSISSWVTASSEHQLQGSSETTSSLMQRQLNRKVTIVLEGIEQGTLNKIVQYIFLETNSRVLIQVD